MIKKVQITKVYRNEKNKNNEPYVIKNGEHAGTPFTRIGIKTDKTGEQVYYNNAKANDKAFSVAEGQSLLLNFTEEIDGSNTWYNFNFPTKAQLAEFAEQSA